VRRAATGEILIPASRLASLIAGSDKSAQLFDPLTEREREARSHSKLEILARSAELGLIGR
jgi:hypothetical protein